MVAGEKGKFSKSDCILKTEFWQKFGMWSVRDRNDLAQLQGSESKQQAVPTAP
jgi:hypothetical protein